MPVHGLRTDVELLLLAVSAMVLSVLVQGNPSSNVFFAVLLGSLFFIEGLHADLSFIDWGGEKKDQYLITLIAVFILTPVLALFFSKAWGYTENVFLVLAASAAALSSPKIWSNISSGDGELASSAGTVSILAALIFSPVIIWLSGLAIDFQLAATNALIAGLPFALGIALQEYENFLIEDMRIHFSKAAFFLITLVTAVQFQYLYVANGISFLWKMLVAFGVFGTYTLFAWATGYLVAEEIALFERESRAIGFLAGSKNVAIAFFFAAMLSGKAIALVGVYYFARQVTGFLISDYFRHEELKIKDRLENFRS